MCTAVIGPPRRRIRICLGQHTISEYYAEAELAARYAAAMSRKFPGLRISDEPLLAEHSVATPELPTNHLLWPLTAL
jgi:hypothetical protein